MFSAGRRRRFFIPLSPSHLDPGPGTREQCVGLAKLGRERRREVEARVKGGTEVASWYYSDARKMGKVCWFAVELHIDVLHVLLLL